MSLVLIASMSHENVVWVINQSDGWVGRTEQLQAFLSGVFPVLLKIISQAWAGLGHHHNYTGLKSALIRDKVTIFICNLLLYPYPAPEQEIECISSIRANRLLFPSSSLQHKTNWVQVVRIISVQIWSSLIFWSWLGLGTCRRSAFTAANLQCCTALNAAWCGIFHPSPLLFSNPYHKVFLCSIRCLRLPSFD
mgnify:CR=1 FL=1